MIDNVVDVSKPFRWRAGGMRRRTKRRIGLGVTGLADALLMLGLRIWLRRGGASDRAQWLHAIARAAYLASVDAGQGKRRVPRCLMPRSLPEGSFGTMQQMDEDVRDAIREHGIRNALLTSIAPTGTISLIRGQRVVGHRAGLCLCLSRARCFRRTAAGPRRRWSTMPCRCTATEVRRRSAELPD